jgi:hypothetical protein
MSTREQRLLAGRQVTAKILTEEIRALTAQTREQLEPTLDTEEAVAAELSDGTRLGKVARSKAAESARVTDAHALLQWVKANHPAEIVESVNPAYEAKLKTLAKKHGHAFDETTGEVIPGIEVIEGSASYRVTPTDGARELVMTRLSELVRGGLLALPTGEDAA